uniref:Uncharacterized protein n=1 Tax=Oryza nivara TaxID=4536 RepID=A0A0E0GJ76_ORYNI
MVSVDSVTTLPKRRAPTYCPERSSISITDLPVACHLNLKQKVITIAALAPKRPPSLRKPAVIVPVFDNRTIRWKLTSSWDLWNEKALLPPRSLQPHSLLQWRRSRERTGRKRW